MSPPIQQFWQALEALPGLSAVPRVWRAWLGPHFDAFSNAFLLTKDYPAELYPCPSPRRCSCAHRVVRQPDGSFIAFCDCDPPECENFPLTLADVTPMYLDPPILGNALCATFHLDPRPADFPIPATWQIGSWSPNLIPAILTIQYEAAAFHRAVGELLAIIHKPIILFAPTAGLFGGTCSPMLDNFGAAFFALESHTILDPDGTLRPRTDPATMFARFSAAVPAAPAFRPSANPVSSLPIRCPAPSPFSLLPSPDDGPVVSSPVVSRFRLRHGLGVWHLIFDGGETIIKNERGILFVAYLLLNPPEHPIHAIDLVAKIPQLYRQQLGLTEIVNPATGLPVQLEPDARLQERSLALDDAELARALLKEEEKLYALLDDPEEIEPVKAEALRRLEELAEFQKQHAHRSVDTAQRLARTTRQAISRLYLKLAAATDIHGNPHPVLRPFSEHINKYILIPSARYSAPGPRTARSGLAGCFTYEPPTGVLWAM
jgi:hypothetical protein